MKTMNVRRWLSILVLLALAASPVVAQESGTAEIGVFGRASMFDPPLGLSDWVGLGARAGYFFIPNLSLEADVSYTATDGPVVAGERQDVSVLPIHARLVYGIPYGGRTRLLMGAGYVHTQYGSDADASGDGAGALLGLRYRPQERISFRLEGTVDWYADTDFVTKENHLDYGIQFGASFMLGGGPGDSDGDGVKDDVDRCPDTPRGEPVDEYGCRLPKDSDGDGVTDDKDKCPDTPRGEKVDKDGCPLPKDSDGDGVTDDKDKCPDTPRGEKVDKDGCSLPKDSDGDGVTDDKDKCPNTPAGTKVDSNGCPQLFEETKTSLVLDGVNFAVGKAELTADSREVLDRVATSLMAYPEVKVEVAGHTDNTGARALNMRLSQQRAEAVRDYLVGKGVAAAQLSAKGYGPDKPIAPNDTEQGRAKNRRTELNKLN